jgi:outer membrane receptor protein involved in Fe transport
LRRLVLALALGCAGARAAEPPGATAELRAQVLARGSREPIAGAAVLARGPGGAEAEAECDAGGWFTLSALAPGEWTVIVAGPQVVKAQFTERLEPRTRLTVHYWVDIPWTKRYQTVVHGAPERVEVERQLTTAELTRIPGTGGDTLRALENLPGVGRSPFNLGLLIVRGGKPTDSRSFLAGTEIPQLYHFGGLTSIVPSHIVDSIDYFPGNFGVRYGRAIAGAIDLDIRPGKSDRLHGYVDTNVWDSGVGLEGPIGKGSFLAGARRSYVDALLAAGNDSGLLPSLPLKFTNAPVYYDYQAALDYPVGGGKLRLLLFGSDDQLRLVLQNPSDVDPSVAGAFQTHIFFHRLQLRWTRTFGDWSFLLVTSDGYNGTEGSLGTALNFSIGVLGSDWRVEGRWRSGKRFSLLVGADLQGALVFLSALVPLPLAEGQQVLPLSAATKYRADERLEVLNIGAYAEGLWRTTDRLSLTAGLRLDWYSPLQHVSFNPRLNARLQVAKYSALKLGVGLFSQDPQPPDYDKVFGNPKLRPESAIHASVSFEQGLYPGLTLELTAFYKQLYDLVTTSLQPILGTDGMVSIERRANQGEGRIYGGELFLRQALSKRLFGWISYTLMRSERRDGPGLPWRLFDYDQTHVLILALSVNLPRGFTVGARFRYVSGFPYTPAHGGQFDSDAAVYVPGAAPVNTARLDAFQSLDLRIDKTFVFNRWLFKIYLDVTNVYDHQNAELVNYSFDFKYQTAITGLPIIPSLGARGEF